MQLVNVNPQSLHRRFYVTVSLREKQIEMQCHLIGVNLVLIWSKFEVNFSPLCRLGNRHFILMGRKKNLCGPSLNCCDYFQSQNFFSGMDQINLCPWVGWSGSYCFVLSLYLPVLNFSFPFYNNLWTVRTREFIYGIYTLTQIPFRMLPRSVTLTL